MSKKTFHNILCPGCFSEIKPNNVVFTAGKGPIYYDKYSEAQITNNITSKIREYIDPALFSGSKTYSDDGVLLKLEDSEKGISADIRLCPYCHYELPYAFIGNKKTHIVSVLGCSGAGKSVYERALIYALRNNGFTMSVKNDNWEIDTMNPADYNVPHSSGSERDSKSTWSATTEIRGPYIYNAQNEEEDFLLVLYDLPGELFNTTREITDSYVSSILRKSDLVVFIIDPTNPRNSRISLENYLNLLEIESFTPNNLAILVNKIDDIETNNIYEAFATFSKKHTVPGSDSENIRSLIEKHFFNLPQNLPANTSYFTSQLFVKPGSEWVWGPQLHEEPFLWWLQTNKSVDKKGKK